jgi:hypothetical protein
MNSLFNPTDVAAMMERIQKLRPDTENLWGKMTVDQMLAHCHMSLQTAIGNHKMPKIFLIGRIVGKMMKKGVLSEKPFGKGSPTDKTYIFTDQRNFEEEKAKTIEALNQFLAGGVENCTTQPHPFFGHFTPEEWAIFQWKHLDHHLRQFGV